MTVEGSLFQSHVQLQERLGVYFGDKFESPNPGNKAELRRKERASWAGLTPKSPVSSVWPSAILELDMEGQFNRGRISIHASTSLDTTNNHLSRSTANARCSRVVCRG